jgi:hypothetical protein
MLELRDPHAAQRTDFLAATGNLTACLARLDALGTQVSVATTTAQQKAVLTQALAEVRKLALAVYANAEAAGLRRVRE